MSSVMLKNGNVICMYVCMYVCVCVCVCVCVRACARSLLSSSLTQYSFKYRHSADHCGHLIMLPNNKIFRDKC